MAPSQRKLNWSNQYAIIGAVLGIGTGILFGDVAEEWTSAVWDERLTYPVLGRMSKLSQAFGDERFRIKDPKTWRTIGRRPGIARRIFGELDETIRDETDPSKRFDLLKDRLEKTDWVLDTANGAAFDERVVPGLGRNALKESSVLREQSDSLVQDLTDLINGETDPVIKRQLARKLLDITKWLRRKWASPRYDERLAPDMSDWPDSLDDILGVPEIGPFAPEPPAPPELPASTPPADAGQCDFDGFRACADMFDLQGCVDACPFIPIACPPGTPPNSECAETDQTCSNACFDRADAYLDQCARQNDCTIEEVQQRFGN